jgi:hypothetical protein
VRRRLRRTMSADRVVALEPRERLEWRDRQHPTETQITASIIIPCNANVESARLSRAQRPAQSPNSREDDELIRHTDYRIARLSFEARYSGTHELFSNSGSRLCDQDLKDFDLLGGIFAMKPV